MGSDFAPIIVFAYNRPLHLAKTLAALAANFGAESSSLTVYCDGAKRDEDLPLIGQVRMVAESAQGFARVEVVQREKNLGLAKSIIQGVSETLQRAGSVIVLEDDIVASPHFLRYMNDALTRYAEAPRVAGIHGFAFPLDCRLPETFFLRGADCWGWATWARAWQVFEPDAGKLLAELHDRGLANAFDFDGAASYLRMLEDFMAGKNDSWAVRWHASAYAAGMLTLHPGRSLVRNIGVDGSGTHGGDIDLLDGALTDRPVRVEAIEIAESREAREAVKRYYLAGRQGVLARILRQARRAFKPRSVPAGTAR